jgi:short-subunit dehydrogenase
MPNFNNVLITGSSRGIGYALAKEFISNGTNLFLIARNIEKLEQLALSENNRVNIIYYQCDVGDKAALNKAIDRAFLEMGRIDLAILNAGIGIPDSFENYSTETLKQIMDVNFYGIANGLEKLIPLMKQQGGGVIAGTTSLADARGFPGSSAYSVSKAAASHLLEASRIELSGSGIKIVTIKPGFVRTDMTAKNNFFMPFLMDVEKAAKIIISGLERGKSRIYFPLPTVFLTYIVKIVPGWLYEGMFKFRKKV